MAQKMKKRLKLRYTRGLPASGKSTYAKELLDKDPGNWKRVNKDDLRALLDNSKWSKSNEDFVVSIRNNIIHNALTCGYNVIVDDTNFETKHIDAFKNIIDVVDPSNIDLECIDFTHVDVRECIKRDSLRVNSVGEKVILKMYDKYLKKALPVYKAPLPNLPKTIICDLDGTLALFEHHRGAFETVKCANDVPNESVLSVLRCFIRDGVKIIFFSGREDKYRPQTIDFLINKCNLSDKDFSLYMRNTGDTTSDYIVKEELFYKYVHGIFNPIFWIDDRLSVVNMARNKIGITVFQVAEGLF